MTKIYDAANWSKHEDDFTQMFYNQNVKQFWLPEEIALNGDLLTWKYLGKNEQDTYMKVLAGLTLLEKRETVLASGRDCFKRRSPHMEVPRKK
ncbi:hypothetical protein D3Z17_09815 [Bacillus subtilis]|nr:hypothetical protein D3Z17_09815 [Bacillus subtilis]